MIQSFNKFSQSRVAKVFLAIVALSFIVFFGGGSWFRSQNGTNVVAEVGGQPITIHELNKRLQEHAKIYQAQSGKTLTLEEMQAARLPELLLEQLVQNKLLGLEAQHLGLTVSDDALRAQIQGMNVFQNDKGEFDKAHFIQLLHSHGISEEAYLADARHDMIQNQLILSVVVGAFLPQDMVDRLFDATYQQRQASMMLITPKDMPIPPPPGDSALETFYKDHQKEFKTPEVRTLTGLIISPDALMKDISVTEEEIKATYEEKLEALGKKPLSDVRGVVVSAIQKEKALEKMHEVTQRLEDEIAGGTTFEELVSTVPGALLVKLEDINQNGEAKSGSLASSLPKDKDLAQEILNTGFELEEGKDSQFSQSSSGTYYSVRVDKIVPSSFEPFTNIKGRVLKVWTENEQYKEAKSKAEKYVTSFNQGNKAISLMTLLPNLSLSEKSPSISEEVKGLVFSLRPGYAGFTATPTGYAVVVLKNIIPPSQKVKTEKMEAFHKHLLNRYKDDLLVAYINALRVRFPVKLNRALLDAAFQEKQSS